MMPLSCSSSLERHRPHRQCGVAIRYSKQPCLGRVYLERKLMALVLVRNTRDDDGADRPVIKGETGHENEG
jgi:hypothetical protein